MSAKFNFKTLDTGFEADWPVSVNVPVDGGKVQEQVFVARFRTPTSAEQAELEAVADSGSRLRRAMEIGFVALGAEEGETLTPELFDRMWRTQNVQLGLIRAYSAFQMGAAAKN